MRKLLKRGNHKLSTKQGIWTLPRSTCIGAGECRKYCYAKKMENMPNVRESRLWKLEQTKRKDFVERIVKEVQGRKIEIIRIHEAGDFYSQGYLEKWFEIAKKLPEVRIYTFTKAFELDFTNTPENLVIIQSYGSRYDNKINKMGNTSRVIESYTELRKIEFLCPYHEKTFTKCGEYCQYCFDKKHKVKHVAFLKH